MRKPKRQLKEQDAEEHYRELGARGVHIDFRTGKITTRGMTPEQSTKPTIRKAANDDGPREKSREI